MPTLVVDGQNAVRTVAELGMTCDAREIPDTAGGPVPKSWWLSGNHPRQLVWVTIGLVPTKNESVAQRCDSFVKGSSGCDDGSQSPSVPWHAHRPSWREPMNDETGRCSNALAQECTAPGVTRRRGRGR